MYGCKSWTVKKTEHWRIGAFELWCWRRLLGVPWTAKRSNQLILKEINPEHTLEGPMLKLKLQYFGHLIWRVSSLEETLMLEKTKDKRSRWQRMRWLDGITDSMEGVWANSGIYWRTGKPGVPQFMGVTKSWMWLSDRTQENHWQHQMLTRTWTFIHCWCECKMV